MSQYAALHGPKRLVLSVGEVTIATARAKGYTGPRFVLRLECGHETWRRLVRHAHRVKCGLCLGPDFTERGFKRRE